jgi:hypothetical protein
MSPLGETSREGLVVQGAARDLRTDAQGRAEVLAAAEVRAQVDADRTLVELRTTPAPDGVVALLGRRVASGFRAAVDGAVPDEAAAQTPLYLLLDDLPVAVLISGYADMYTGPAVTPPPGSLQADICSGWRRDGTMLRSLDERGVLPLPVGPPAPDLDGGDDPVAWHPIAPIAPGAMRRRRLIDVRGDDVRAMFRDSHLGPDGVERVLHEYELRATIADGVFTECVAEPRTLPWPECPHAAASAGRLVGVPVAGARDLVRAELRGVGTCTHLNDLLRSLADVAGLVASLGTES